MKAITRKGARLPSEEGGSEWHTQNRLTGRLIEELADMAASVEAQSIASQVPEHMPVHYPPGVADLMAVVEDLTEMAAQVVEYQTSPQFVYKSLMGLCEDYKASIRAHMGVPTNIHNKEQT